MKTERHDEMAQQVVNGWLSDPEIRDHHSKKARRLLKYRIAVALTTAATDAARAEHQRAIQIVERQIVPDATASDSLNGYSNGVCRGILAALTDSAPGKAEG